METWIVVGGLLTAAAVLEYALSRTRFGEWVFRFGQNVGHSIKRLITGR